MKNQIFEIHSQEELEEIIKNNKGKLIIDFTSPTCGPCLMLEPIFEKLVEMQLCSIGKIDISEYPEIAIKNNISATPTLIIVKDSNILKSVIGYQPFEVWEEMLKKI